jgi:anti-sigma regulatory factor (Ser/Thr protein kinase)
VIVRDRVRLSVALNVRPSTRLSAALSAPPSPTCSLSTTANTPFLSPVVAPGVAGDDGAPHGSSSTRTAARPYPCISAPATVELPILSNGVTPGWHVASAASWVKPALGAATGAYHEDVAAAEHAVAPGAFRHEALFYAGDEDFVDRATPFLREGVRRQEPVLVVVSAKKIDMLTDSLGNDASGVQFADMAGVGLNPARIIPAWREFVAARPDGRGARGIGEPIWAARPAEELVESQRHEMLLNVAFAGVDGFSLVCPYDTASLPQDVVDEALRSHPLVHGGGDSPRYDATLPEHPLPPPPAGCAELRYGSGPLDVVHRFVTAQALAAGLPPSRAIDLSIAAHELAINSIRHAGGRGVVLVWTEDDAVVCEVSDDGLIADPLVGRVKPGTDQENGRGMWMVNQLCDLVQLRSSEAGTTVRVRMALDWSGRTAH